MKGLLISKNKKIFFKIITTTTQNKIENWIFDKKKYANKKSIIKTNTTKKT